ncbi:hypothetical protein M407DRAFT_242147 [Tulasnella calospora MUT 4182]|uniref:Uncharacterized protein n=1 Tax=Tulasnella calospora MUT 4182 TaxID=1051891 RepID=A0A0C3QGB0_9AGAM|nr:hypothetical protein M407DRAFT_242147 [Tulasnella calospora MUT 4182]
MAHHQSTEEKDQLDCLIKETHSTVDQSPREEEEEECPYVFVPETRGRPFVPASVVRPAVPEPNGDDAGPAPTGFIAAVRGLFSS